MAFLRTLFHREREPAPLCSAVIVAAGRASRMEGIDKILTPMGGQPLLLYTLAPFQACEQVGEIVIVTREDLMVPIGTLCSQHGLTKVRRVVKGGESRTESVLAGLGETDPQAALVAIHDGARPFLPEAVLEEAIQAAAQHGAAAPAIPVKDTIKVAQAGVVQSTPDRGQLFAVQTPQVFDRALLQEALGQAAEEAGEVLSTTGDPQRSDFALDRAYFREMLEAAQSSGSQLLTGYVRATIDSANLRSAVRTLRMKKSGDFLRQVLFEGGAVGTDSILAAALNGNLEAPFRGTELRAAAELGAEAAKGGNLTAFEKACDDAVTDYAARAKHVPFGEETVIGYLVAKEIEFTAVRVIMSGKMAGIDGGTIRERLREAYV